MVDFVNLANTAQRLIEANGRQVTFRRDDRAPADPGKPYEGPAPTVTPGDGEELTPIMAFVPPSGAGLGILRMIDPTLREQFDEVGLVAANSLPAGTELERFDSVLDNGRPWRIGRVARLQPGTVPLLFAVGLKG